MPGIVAKMVHLDSMHACMVGRYGTNGAPVLYISSNNINPAYSSYIQGI